MNAVGERTLEYLRGERDLFEERKRLAEVKQKVESSDLSYWLAGANKRRVERFWQVVALLQEYSRMTMTEMSKRLKVPVSTLCETLKQVEKLFDFTIVLKGNDRNTPLSGTIPVQSTYQFIIDMEDENAVALKLQTE